MKTLFDILLMRNRILCFFAHANNFSQCSQMAMYTYNFNVVEEKGVQVPWLHK